MIRGENRAWARKDDCYIRQETLMTDMIVAGDIVGLNALKKAELVGRGD